MSSRLRAASTSDDAPVTAAHPFSGRPIWKALAGGLLLVAVATFLDLKAQDRLVVVLTFLLPVLLVTWRAGRRWGYAFAVVCAAVGVAVAVYGSTSSGEEIAWGTATALLVYLGAVAVTESLRVNTSRQWQSLANEAQESRRLQEMNDLKDTLLHAVFHDLKNPLSGIIASIRAVRGEMGIRLTFEEREELYGLIESGAQKMNAIIDNLLDLDRIDRGNLQPRREPVDPADLIRNVIADTPPLQELDIVINSADLVVEVDPSKVERIVENLLMNALRHTPDGTKVSVTIGALEDGMELVVEDEGHGVPDPEKSYVFEPFRRGEDATDRKGLGIGLSLVREFARLHGGDAVVTDTMGGGARFVVTIPGRVCDRGDLTQAPATEQTATL